MYGMMCYTSVAYPSFIGLYPGAKMTPQYRPDFDEDCYICGASPTVVVNNHVVPETRLCGPHFFGDRAMVDWANWNDTVEDSE